MKKDKKLKNLEQKKSINHKQAKDRQQLKLKKAPVKETSLANIFHPEREQTVLYKAWLKKRELMS